MELGGQGGHLLSFYRNMTKGTNETYRMVEETKTCKWYSNAMKCYKGVEFSAKGGEGAKAM